MFQFRFQVNEDENTTGSKDVSDTVEARSTPPVEADVPTPYPCEEIQLPMSESGEVKDLLTNTYTITNDIQLILVNLVDETFSNGEIKVEREHSDLIPNRYEGGLKLWECSFDLGWFIATQNEQDNRFRGKVVLDLGCGAGMVGLVAAKLGAKGVHFQDYNRDVLESTTIKNCALNQIKWNGDGAIDVRCFAGDWETFTEKFDSTYDLILTSETIYSVANYYKLLQLFDRKLAPDGVILLAAKTYYFGVGGGLRLFEQSLNDEGLFEYCTVWQCETGVKREILELKRRKQRSKT